MKHKLEQRLKLRQTLPYSIDGYWNGGAQRVLEWGINGSPKKDSKGYYVKVGSFAANHWFHVALGKTKKITLCNAMKHLRGTDIGKQSKFEYIEE